MSHPSIFLFCVALVLSAAAAAASADPLIVDASVSARPGGDPFQLGTMRNPNGETFTADHISLLLDGKPWMGAMGEFHFTRVPESEWRNELLKMKAGGIDIVASYVFWIHHEEIEGKFDWTGNKDLAKFVSIAGGLGLKVFIRCGPWAHGECRNGGFPDWMLHKGLKLRSEDPAYLAEVTKLYQEIAKQLNGQLWKDGGPVIGIQVENEFGGSPAYMIHLKQIARDAGIDVPLYTRTGWPAPRKAYPPNQLLPMYGAYPVGFWDRNLAPTGGKYGDAFLFLHQRIDSEIGNDELGHLPTTEPEQAQTYPFLCCEMGGGMMTSYHRRIQIDPLDIYALSLTKLGSGANLLGYYMYHGGMNPDGELSTLQESQATNYPNDLPVKTYDFQAPLGEYGQIRSHYGMLRRLHLFLHDFGTELAPMPTVLPELRPNKSSDTQQLRWCVRTDGNAGFLFVNNYQRLQTMPAKDAIQFDLRLKDSTLRIPRRPLTIPSESSFFWPFNLDLGGAKLIYATAQPICRLVDGKTTYTVFIPTTARSAEFAFDTTSATVESASGDINATDGESVVSQVQPGTDAAIKVHTSDGRDSVIILLGDSTSFDCWKGKVAGKETICLTRAGFTVGGNGLDVTLAELDRLYAGVGGLTVDGNNLNLTSGDPDPMSVSLLPAPGGITINGNAAIPQPDGLFQKFTATVAPIAAITATPVIVQSPGPARQIKMGHGKVAEAPTDADFDTAAVWRIKLPADTAPDRDILLRIHYVGDVARLYLDGKLIDDNFYNGTPFDLGLRRFAPDVYKKELLLKVLPLRKDAPIYLPPDAWPKFEDSSSGVALNSIDVIENRTAHFVTSDGKATP